LTGAGTKKRFREVRKKRKEWNNAWNFSGNGKKKKKKRTS
jgi:hypothetical protein